MNKERWRKINEGINHIRLSNRIGSHQSCIRLNPACSDEHNLKIVQLCMEFLKTKVPFYTEAELILGGRPDIFLPITLECYEIMKSETDESIEAKRKRYPSLFSIKEIRI